MSSYRMTDNTRQYKAGDTMYTHKSGRYHERAMYLDSDHVLLCSWLEDVETVWHEQVLSMADWQAMLDGDAA